MIKLAIILFLMFAAFSTETETDEDEVLSQPISTENESDQAANKKKELEQVMKELEQQVENLLNREQRVKVAEEKLHARVENLLKREQSVQVVEKKLHAREKKFQEFQEEKLKQIEKIDQFAQDLQKLEDALQKQEQSITAREETLSAEEKRLKEREQRLQEKTERFNLQKEHLKKQKREQSIHSTELIQSNMRNFGNPDSLKMTSKILAPTNLFPNETSVAVFRNEETNEITWKDPQNLIQNEFKEKLESSLQQNGKEMSNGLFYHLSNSFLPRGSKPFIKVLMYAMSENVSVEKREYNRTPLMFCSNFGAEKAVAKLIERRANLEAADEYGSTALHLAACKGNVSSCRVLLQQGANVNSRDNYGWTPLMQAVQCERTEVVQLLQEFGADKIKEKFDTALKMAPKRCNSAPLKSRSSNEKNN